MIATERNLNPSPLPDEQVRMIAAACAVYIRDIFEEKPMTLEETCNYMNRTRKHVTRLKNDGTIKAHYIPGDKRPYFLKSEILKVIKAY